MKDNQENVNYISSYHERINLNPCQYEELLNDIV